jgi:hypothetical protein
MMMPFMDIFLDKGSDEISGKLKKSGRRSLD